MGGRSRNSRKKYRKTKPQRILIRCGFLVGAGGLKEPGSRLPAAASCLGRHAHPAGRSPNSSSLFLPLAAVVAVAQGLSPAGLFGGSMLFESTLAAPFARQIKQKLQYPVRILEFLVGAGGFEPPKLKSSRFTVCPHWPLGNTPRFCSHPLPDDLFILSDCGRFVNYFFRIFAAFLRKLSAGSVLGQMFPALVIPQGGNGFAGHGV